MIVSYIFRHIRHRLHRHFVSTEALEHGNPATLSAATSAHGPGTQRTGKPPSWAGLVERCRSKYVAKGKVRKGKMNLWTLKSLGG